MFDQKNQVIYFDQFNYYRLKYNEYRDHAKYAKINIKLNI